MAFKSIRTLQQIIASAKKTRENSCSVLEMITLLQGGAKPSILNQPEGEEYVHRVIFRKIVYTARTINPVQTLQLTYHPD